MQLVYLFINSPCLVKNLGLDVTKISYRDVVSSSKSGVSSLTVETGYFMT